MKKIIFFFAIVTLIAACRNNNSQSTTATTHTVADANAAYAYTIKNPDQWELGDRNNVKIALNALKAYERGNISAAFKDYADTVLIQMDGFERRLSKDSLLSLFLRERSGLKRMGIEMNDFVSLRSKDGRSDYVSVWYKQLWEDQEGRIDSMECMDDFAFRNGKIILWNEKVRRYPRYGQ
jgi:hypothetical protein